MKKTIAMLLLSVMSLSLVACGETKEEELTAGEGQEAVEITAENWDTYFEIEEIVDTSARTLSDGTKITIAYVDYVINLKDEYTEKFDKADLDVTYDLGKQEVKKLVYDVKAGTYTLEASTVGFPSDEKTEGTITVTEAETQMYINAYADNIVDEFPSLWETITSMFGGGEKETKEEQTTYECDTMTRPELKVTNVEGKIILDK